MSEALQLARSIQDKTAHAITLASIGDAQVKAELTKEAAATFPEALQATSSIRDKAERAIALSRIAEALPN